MHKPRSHCAILSAIVWHEVSWENVAWLLMQTGTVSAFMSPSETELMNKLTFSPVLLACWTLREKQKHHLEKQGGQKMTFHFNFDLTLTLYCHVFGFGGKSQRNYPTKRENTG